MRIRQLMVATAAAALAGCSGWSWWPFGSSSAPDRPWYPADAAVYRCEGNKTLVVRYLDGGKAAMVMFPEREFRLDAIRTALRQGARRGKAISSFAAEEVARQAVKLVYDELLRILVQKQRADDSLLKIIIDTMKHFISQVEIRLLAKR